MRPLPLPILLPLLFAAAPTTAPTPLAIDKQTTWATAPLLPDGTVDYPAALRQLAAPTTPDKDNAAPLLEKAIAAFHDFAEAATDRAEQIRLHNYAASVGGTRWSAADNPDIAAWIERNHEALDLLDQASRRTCLSSPSTLDDAWRTHITSLVRCLTSRAAMRAAAGDQPAARADVATLFRLAPLFQPLPDLEAVATGSVIQEFAFSTALLAAQVAGPNDRAQWLALARAVPEYHAGPLATASVRCRALTYAMPDLHRGPLVSFSSLISLPILPAQVQAALAQTDLPALDHNVVCRTINTAFDRFDKIRTEPFLDALDDSQTLLDEIAALPAPFGLGDGLRAQLARNHGRFEPPQASPEASLAQLLTFLRKRPSESTDAFSQRLSPYFFQIAFAQLQWTISGEVHAAAWRRLHITALAALDFRSKTSHFPATLDDLHLPPDLTIDPFSNEPLFWIPDADTLTLYSVGPNRRNDRGTPHTDATNPADDIPLHLTP